MHTLKDFLSTVSDHERMAPGQIVQVTTARPQQLFVARCIERLKAIFYSRNIPVIVCDIAQLKKSQLQAQLEMGFLGTRSLYILYMGGDGTGKCDPALLEYLQSYARRSPSGEHTIILFTPDTITISKNDAVAHYALSPVVTTAMYHELYQFLYGQETKDIRFIQAVCTEVDQLSYDTACVLMQYQVLLGRNAHQFVTHWLDRIVVRKHSLFTLSQYLFAQDFTALYATWSIVAPLYPIEFWIAFWSEQVWQALTFVTIATSQGPLVAKKAVSRLPFSFINKDWRAHSAQRLVQAYEMLYAFDYAHKHGGVSEPWELFFKQFYPQKTPAVGRSHFLTETKYAKG